MAESMKSAILRYKGILLAVIVFAAVITFVPSLHDKSVAKPPQSTGKFTPYKPPGEGLSGTTVGGYTCTPGRRQVPWSLYAPYCVPKWTGTNGGSTSPGVTATTVNVSVNYASNGGLCPFLASMESKSIASEALFKKMINTYVALFNKDFELWGRKVVIKYFNGQGCYASELLGQDQAQAEADAQTAASLNVFILLHFLLSCLYRRQ